MVVRRDFTVTLIDVHQRLLTETWEQMTMRQAAEYERSSLIGGWEVVEWHGSVPSAILENVNVQDWENM